MADTATTTASEARTHTGHRPAVSHRGPAILAGLAGCLLLALGFPRLVSGVMTLEARAVLWDVYSGDAERTREQITDAAADLAAAGLWVRDGELEGDRSLLLLRAAEASTGAGQKELLAAAEASAVSALAAAPGQPSVWFRLAYLRHMKGDAPAAAAALRMSMLSGAFVRALMAPRIELALRLLPAMDREMAGLLERQIRLTWVVDPDYVAGLGTRPEAGTLVRNALAGLTEEEMGHFLRLHGNRR